MKFSFLSVSPNDRNRDEIRSALYSLIGHLFQGVGAMSLTLRPPTKDDVNALAKLIFDAFACIHDRHNFPRDLPSIEAAMPMAQAWVNHPKVWGILAEEDGGRLVVCNFLDERNSVPGVGPVCVDPASQGTGVGRRVMQAVLERARQIDARSVRLLQDAFNMTSLSLYASLGFDAKEPAVLMQGKFTGGAASGNSNARPMRESDLPACAELCRRVHGFDRTGALRDAIAMFRPVVLERGGRITAYASAPTFYIMN